MAQYIQIFSRKSSGRASAFTPKKASITVEAAYALPFFFFCVICFIYLLEIAAIQTAVQSGMHYACKNYAQNASFNPLLSTAKLEKDMVDAIGKTRLNRSIIYNGSKGLSTAKSYITPGSQILECKVEFRVQLPISFFGNHTMKLKNSMRIKGWTGYTEVNFTQGKEKTFYVTENGIVYHKNPRCTYLDLSIQPVFMSQVAKMRNQYKEKYYPCESCIKAGNKNQVYITETGNRYHSTVDCSGLRRTVYSVHESELNGRRGCSRCGI